MRKIKFRAWNKTLNKMYEHEELLSMTKRIINNDFVTGLYLPLNSDIVIMQYIGLKDKNKKEIYEGDIIKFLDEEVVYTDYDINYNEFTNIGQIIFSHNDIMGWDITNRKMDLDAIWHYREYIEVIGNIYIYPELKDRI